MFRLAVTILLPALVIAADFEEEAGVLVLTRANFDESIKTHKNILVEFYAPWCGHCQDLAPEYAKAAALLANRKPIVKLAKVDATVEEELADKYNVESYPTLTFFENGVPVDYTGGRSSKEITNWVIERLPTEESIGPVHILTTQESIDSFLAAHEKSLIAYNTDPNSPLIKMFMDVAPTVNDYPFGFVQEESLFDHKHAQNGKIYFYKKEPLGMTDAPLADFEYEGDPDPKVLQEFITSRSLPSMIEFNADTAHYVFDSKIKTHVLLFVSKNNGDIEYIPQSLLDLALEYTGEVLFVLINTDDADHEKILKMVGLTNGFWDIPDVRIIKLGEKGEITKYKPKVQISKQLNSENVKEFLNEYLEGKLESYLLSEKLPRNWNDNPVTVLVSDNFDDIAFDKEQTVLVMFYSPWCGYCHRFAPIYDKVAEVFAHRFGVGDGVVIAKIDATANELEHTKITHYPTIKLYKKGTNKVVDFTGNRTLDALVKFVETGGRSIEKVDEKLQEKDEL